MPHVCRDGWCRVRLIGVSRRRRASDFWWKRSVGRITDVCHSCLWIRHVGHVYVDDWLFLFAQRSGHPRSSLAVMFYVGLGVSLSWRKLVLGTEVPWLGLVLSLRVPAWFLPSTKIERIRTVAKRLECVLTDQEHNRCYILQSSKCGNEDKQATIQQFRRF